MIVGLSTSPPSRCTVRVAASMRSMDRVTRISAPSRRACCSARLASSSPDTPGGEAQVVLDPRRRAGLPARRLALDHDRPQALRRAVDGGGQAGRPCADDDRVVVGGLRLGAKPEQLGDPAKPRPHDGLAADDADRRKVVLRRSGPSQVGRVVGVGLSHVADLVAVEEAPQLGARASHRWPRTIARGGGGSAARPPEPPILPASAPDRLRDRGRHGGDAW